MIVLDVAMPGLDGLAVCRRLRAKGLATPILMLTARDAVSDRVAGLEAGADDYLVKPFASEELVARIRALTRRTRRPGLGSHTRTWSSTWGLAPLSGRRRAIELTGREAALLELLLRHGRSDGHARVRPRGDLAGAAEANVVDRYITRLRRKLGAAGADPTVRGSGFAPCVRPLIPRTLRPLGAWRAVVSSLAGVAVLAVALGADRRPSAAGLAGHRASPARPTGGRARGLRAGGAGSPGALESPVSGHQIVVEVIDAHGRIIARSLTLGAELLPEDPLARGARVAGRTGFENVDVGGRRFRLYAAPIADAGGPAAGGAVLVASDTTDITNTINHIGFLVAVIGAAVALVAALVAAVLSTRVLRPLRRLATAAEEIEQTADPSKRLPEPPVADEVAQLSGVLNRMLAALEQSRENERRFLADASHELRTPVATLLGNVEYAARHGADEEVLADLSRDAGRLARLVDDLLVLERAGEGERELAAIELDDLVEAVVHGHDDGADRVRLDRVERVRVKGEPEELRRVLENLIENALVHGPEGGRVTVALTAANGHALLSVRDDGAGPDPASRDRLFERFWRGPDAAQRSGSGLGLSIVSAVVERHGGRVLVDGPTFTIELPALSAPTEPTASG